MPLYFGGSGVTPSLKTGFNRISLAIGQTWIIQPAGWYFIKPGPYTVIQQFDPILGVWVQIGGGGTGADEEYFYSDGGNYRLANLTGCAVGALITNHGTGYTSAPTVTIASQNSIWKAVVGGACATPTVTNGGSNYTYPPVVTFAAPPTGGVQATGYAVLSGGALSSITMVNVGAGYTSPPAISISNDPREGVNGVTQGYGAAAITSLTGSGQVLALLCLDPGNPGSTGLSSVPSFTISGGGGSSFAATPIMCWSITAFSVGGTGTGFTGNSLLSAIDVLGTTSISAASTNPAIQQSWVKGRSANILLPESGGAPTATGAVFIDGGIYTSVPTPLVTTNGALITHTETFTFTMGGYADTSYISS